MAARSGKIATSYDGQQPASEDIGGGERQRECRGGGEGAEKWGGESE